MTEKAILAAAINRDFTDDLQNYFLLAEYLTVIDIKK